MHFQDFEQINWNEVVNSKDEITIAIAPTTIGELDKHKYNSNKKVSRKVKKLLPKIESFIEDASKCKYNLVYIEQRPSDGIFQNHGLDKREQDDHILASILEFTSNHANQSVIYVTNDVGPRLKGKRLGINVMRLPERYLISEEPDTIEKELVSVQKELLSLKNRMPILKIFFDQDVEILSPDLSRRKKLLREEFVQKQMEDIRLKHTRMYYYPPELKSNHPLMRFANNPMFSPSEEQIENYNDQLEKFYREYEAFASALYNVYLLKFNSVELKFILKNIGTAPAQDIDLNFHFPDGFDLYTKGKIPAKSRKEPQPPTKPKSRLDLSFNLSNSILNPVQPNPIRLHDMNFDVNCSKPTIKRTNSYNVHFHIKTLKHHQSELLETIYIKYEDIDFAKGFAIDYKIIAANIPDIITGRLHVKI